jgi:hypothetical protein
MIDINFHKQALCGQGRTYQGSQEQESPLYKNPPLVSLLPESQLTVVQKGAAGEILLFS